MYIFEMKNLHQIMFGGIVLLLISTSHVLAQNTKTSIAIYPFESSNLSAAQAEIYTGQLRSLLVESNHFNIIERSRMNLVLQEQGFTQSGSTQEAIELGKILNVEYILTGNFALNTGRTYATAELINTKTSQVERSARIQSEEGDHDFINNQLPILVRKIENPGFQPTLSKTKSLAWILSGGAFLSGGLGMYFESQAQSSLLDFEKQPSYQKLSELDDYQNYRDISYYTAAAIATSALVLWFWPEAEDNNISILPTPQSLTLTGRF